MRSPMLWLIPEIQLRKFVLIIFFFTDFNGSFIFSSLISWMACTSVMFIEQFFIHVRIHFGGSKSAHLCIGGRPYCVQKKRDLKWVNPIYFGKLWCRGSKILQCAENLVGFSIIRCTWFFIHVWWFSDLIWSYLLSFRSRATPYTDAEIKVPTVHHFPVEEEINSINIIIKLQLISLWFMFLALWDPFSRKIGSLGPYAAREDLWGGGGGGGWGQMGRRFDRVFPRFLVNLPVLTLGFQLASETDVG